MTRRVSDTRTSDRRAPRLAALGGVGARLAPLRGALGPFAAPLVSLAGLVVIAIVSVALFGGTLAYLGGSSPGGQDNGTTPLTPDKTPSPSAPPVINKDISIQGWLVYVKAGNLWIQNGTDTRKLTTTGRDSQPSWSADGNWVYFIETRHTRAKFPQPGNANPSWYDLNYPILTRVHRDGSGREAVMSGLYRASSSTSWFYFLIDPAVSPDGTQVAVGSDGPDPTNSNVVLQFVDLKHKRLVNPKVPQTGVLGHQDPAWRPDGKALLYVRNERDGGPVIWRYDMVSKSAKALTDGGYMQPSYSPDGRYVAAVKTNTLGTNVVVLDARNGAELLRITTDGRSWGPAWSPDGKQIAFLRLAQSGLTTDVQMATIGRTANGAPTLDGDPKPLTESSGLDGDSRPAWWGPAPTPAPTPSAAPSTAAPTNTGSPSPSAP